MPLSTIILSPEYLGLAVSGGIATMVRDLAQHLHSQGTDVKVIMPLYFRDHRGNEQDFEGTEFVFDVEWAVQGFGRLSGTVFSFKIYKKVFDGVKIYLMYQPEIFNKLYPGNLGTREQLRLLTAYSRISLLIVEKLGLTDSVIITNDWTGGFCAALAKRNYAPRFEKTKFLHILHNLDKDYEGRIYLEPFEPIYQEIHGIEKKYLVDRSWNDPIINPSRCALMNSDQWATVSNTYKLHLLSHSPLKKLLAAFPSPLGQSNGINKQALRESLKTFLKEELGLSPTISYASHLACKAYLQQTYFGRTDPQSMLLTTIGRVVEQKQILAVLEVVEQLLQNPNSKLMVLIAGRTIPGDPYGEACLAKSQSLCKKYPDSFWADPSSFFTGNCPALFHGSDFGLLASRFEPGGLVQLEYFACDTPVVATQTGGLKDTVVELDRSQRKGSGLLVKSDDNSEGYSFKEALKQTLLEAQKVFEEESGFYQTIREQTASFCVEIETEANAYLKEIKSLKKAN